MYITLLRSVFYNLCVHKNCLRLLLKYRFHCLPIPDLLNQRALGVYLTNAPVISYGQASLGHTAVGVFP